MNRSATSAAEGTSEWIVSSWVDAFNARDLNRMLFWLSRDVDFHPLRLSESAPAAAGTTAPVGGPRNCVGC